MEDQKPQIQQKTKTSRLVKASIIILFTLVILALFAVGQLANSVNLELDIMNQNLRLVNQNANDKNAKNVADSLQIWSMAFLNDNATKLINDYATNSSMNCLGEIKTVQYGIYGQRDVARLFYDIENVSYSVELHPMLDEKKPIECGMWNETRKQYFVIDCSNICKEQIADR